MELKVKNALLTLVQGDITTQAVDAIVNAANSGLMGGGGVDGAIHRAGGPAILDACKEIVARQGRLLPGRAVITVGGRLPARYVIHTVGPVWRGGHAGEPQVLAGAYRESLLLAVEAGLKTIAFPSVSTGAYGYPLEEAAQVAVGEAYRFLLEEPSLHEVRFVLYDSRSFLSYSRAVEQQAASLRALGNAPDSS